MISIIFQLFIIGYLISISKQTISKNRFLVSKIIILLSNILIYYYQLLIDFASVEKSGINFTANFSKLTFALILFTYI